MTLRDNKEWNSKERQGIIMRVKFPKICFMFITTVKIKYQCIPEKNYMDEQIYTLVLMEKAKRV